MIEYRVDDANGTMEERPMDQSASILWRPWSR
jgi:hypothetical protein